VKYKVLLVVAIATILCVLYMMHVESDTEDAYSSRWASTAATVPRTTA